MTCICRNLMCFILTTALLVAGMAQGVAGVAMSQRVGLTGMVICGEMGAELVLFGADGAPVPVLPMIDCKKCPACAQTLTATLAVASTAPAAETVLSRLVATPPCHQTVPRRAFRSTARGPPR